MNMKPLEVLLFLLSFGSILFLTYIVTRYIAGKSNKALKGKHINIIETISLGTDKRIHLVKAGKQYILIASTSKNIEFLTSLNLEEGEEENSGSENASQNIFDFKSIFEKYMNSYKNRKNNPFLQKKSDTTNNRTEVKKFRNNLDRLKNITQKTVHKDGDDITNEE